VEGGLLSQGERLRRNGIVPPRQGLSARHEILNAVQSTGTLFRVRETTPLGYVIEYGRRSILGVLIYLTHFYTAWIPRNSKCCNPPDNIFLVALPYKLLGIKYIFDHHDANPELYLSSTDKNGILLQDAGLAGKTDVPLCGHCHATNASYKETWL